ncbi:MAG TPA: CheB methylesterase domain-containing protein, partial [Magnetospirillum sp.]|nr:CheB methylesterase domain-containing protein [Magnetospirillum sp.]
FKVRIAQPGDIPEPGVVHVPPADRHLAIEDGKLVLDDSPPLCSQKPSGSVLLSSIARSMGRRAIGVVLTGMGSDGAEGLADLHQAGGHTIAEHESTCVVYGMPAAAAKLGAVKEMLPLPDIAPRLIQLAGGK